MTRPDEVSVLVCAPRHPDGRPHVVLADGSYDTPVERIFWRHSREAEVLRLPLQHPVSVRPVRAFPASEPNPDGERQLLAALAKHRTQPTAEKLDEAEEPAGLVDHLEKALFEGNAQEAETVAQLLAQQQGLAQVHVALSRCLATAGEAWSEGTGTVLQERLLSGSVRTVLERARAGAPKPGPTAETVLLAVPEGDRHTLALLALAHQVEAAGRRALVVDDLPAAELAHLAATESAVALLLSAHVPVPTGRLRELLSLVRDASPTTLIALGGPGAKRSMRGADLVSDEVAEVLRVLDAKTAVLTDREREVLLLVAEGLTNAEIADAIGVSRATVKTHLDHVFVKTRTVHRAAAVAHAFRHGWIQ